MNISNAIAALRESKGIKQVEIAQKLGIEQSNYSRLEKRGDKLTIEQIISIAQALGVTLMDILTWGEERQSEEELRKQVIELSQQRDELIDSLNRAYKIVDAFLDRMSESRDISKDKLIEIAENSEVDLDGDLKASPNRLNSDSNSQ